MSVRKQVGNNNSRVKIRKGGKKDLPTIFNLIKELAQYENSLDKILITIKDLEKDGFGKNPLYWILVAEIDGEIIGMAFYYIRYSTWTGKILYLEDFIVKEAFRRMGVGSLLFEECIRMSRKIKANGMVWQVLNWNKSAINFYKKYNAEIKNDWSNGKLNKKQINSLIT